MIQPGLAFLRRVKMGGDVAPETRAPVRDPRRGAAPLPVVVTVLFSAPVPMVSIPHCADLVFREASLMDALLPYVRQAPERTATSTGELRLLMQLQVLCR